MASKAEVTRGVLQAWGRILAGRIVPCQFGGDPDCSNCGCIASASLEAIARHRLPGGVRVGQVFNASLKVGTTLARFRGAS